MTALSKGVIAAAILFLLAGCSQYPAAPMMSVFGSFVPSWIVCAIVGVLSAVLLRQIFVWVGIDEVLPLRLLVYLSASVLVGIVFWFLLFAGMPQ
jgi:hypothetical protein